MTTMSLYLILASTPIPELNNYALGLLTRAIIRVWNVIFKFRNHGSSANLDFNWKLHRRLTSSNACSRTQYLPSITKHSSGSFLIVF